MSVNKEKIIENIVKQISSFVNEAKNDSNNFELDLGSSSITDNILETALDRFDKSDLELVKRLNLSSNKLKLKRVRLSKYFPELVELNCADNMILNCESFENLTRLEKLILNENEYISSLSDIFTLKNLSVLELANCALSKEMIQSSLISVTNNNPSSIETLDISSNPKINILPSNISVIETLKILKIKENEAFEGQGLDSLPDRCDVHYTEYEEGYTKKTFIKNNESELSDLNFTPFYNVEDFQEINSVVIPETSTVISAIEDSSTIFSESRRSSAFISSQSIEEFNDNDSVISRPSRSSSPERSYDEREVFESLDDCSSQTATTTEETEPDVNHSKNTDSQTSEQRFATPIGERIVPDNDTGSTTSNDLSPQKPGRRPSL